MLGRDADQIVLLDENSGELRVADPSAFDSAVTDQVVLTVLVRDIHIDTLTDTALVTIIITDS